MLGSTPGAEPSIYLISLSLSHSKDTFRFSVDLSFSSRFFTTQVGAHGHESSSNSRRSLYVADNSFCRPPSQRAGGLARHGHDSGVANVGNDVEGGRRKDVFPLPSRPSRQSRGGSAVLVGAAIRNARSNTNDCRSEQLHRILLRFGRRRRPRARIFMGCRECF